MKLISNILLTTLLLLNVLHIPDAVAGDRCQLRYQDETETIRDLKIKVCELQNKIEKQKTQSRLVDYQQKANPDRLERARYRLESESDTVSGVIFDDDKGLEDINLGDVLIEDMDGLTAQDIDDILDSESDSIQLNRTRNQDISDRLHLNRLNDKRMGMLERQLELIQQQLSRVEAYAAEQKINQQEKVISDDEAGVVNTPGVTTNNADSEILRKIEENVNKLVRQDEALSSDIADDFVEWGGELVIETTFHSREGEFEQKQFRPSLALQPYYKREFGVSGDQLTVSPFVRWDALDSERTHFDLSEFHWTHSQDNWRALFGISKVFWGVTEFRNIIDVVNQRDDVENKPDAKLGQPMVNLTVTGDDSIFDAYLLTAFRERTYAGENGRLRLPIEVDAENSIVDKAAYSDMDFAVRWKYSKGDFNVSLSHFWGRSREPVYNFNFDFDRPRLIPIYELVNRTGLEFEWLISDWTVKTELVSQQGGRLDYEALTLGIERTHYALFDSSLDMTWIVEAMYDSRDEFAPHFFEQDIAFGTRFYLNDEYETTGIVGVLYDVMTDEMALNLEGGRMLSDDWQLKIVSRVFFENETVVRSAEIENGVANLMGAIVGGRITDAQLLLEEFNRIINTDQLVDGSSPEFLQFVGDILVNNGGLDLQQSSVIDTMNYLNRLADSENKMNLYERENHVKIEVIRHF